MRTEPAAQERPKSFHRLHMNFAQAVAIFIASALAPSMADTLMLVSPDMPASINAILVCLHTCTWNNGVFDEGLDGLLLDMGHQIDHHVPSALHHLKDGWSFLRQGATTSFSLQSASTSVAPLGLYPLGWPLWPAITEASSHSTAFDRSSFITVSTLSTGMLHERTRCPG